jgi:hypothetical protein
MSRTNIGNITVNYWMVPSRKEGAMTRPKGLGNNVEWARMEAVAKARKAIDDLSPIIDGNPVSAEEKVRRCGHALCMIHELVWLLNAMRNGEAPIVDRLSALQVKNKQSRID